LLVKFGWDYPIISYWDGR